MSNYTQVNILLVDDDESFITFFATVLRDEYKHRIVLAKSGEEALDILRNGRSFFDLIFLDYFMPGMTGIDVLRTLGELRNETPVIVLTGAGNEEIAVEAMKLGAYDYMRKEQMDLHHLGTIIEATRERHMFRIAKALEDEEAKEILLNKEATEKVRHVINAITPAMNSALADIAVELEINAKNALAQLPEGQRKGLQSVLHTIDRQVNVLESGIKGLLTLYQLVYARHDMSQAIDGVRKELEEKLRSLQERSPE